MMGQVELKAMLVMGALLASAGQADAQRSRGPGGFVGISFVAADAQGEMGAVVDQGFGLELAGGIPMAADGHLRLRGDMGFVIYGLKSIHYCDYSCWVDSEVTTANSIVYGGIGPELVLARGDFQPYVRASAGFSYFVTSSSIDHHDGYGPHLQTTNYSDVVFGWKYGGGFRFRAGGRAFIDLGVERHDNGQANYLTSSDMVDNPDGSVTMYPNRTEADLLSFRLGVSFAVGS